MLVVAAILAVMPGCGSVSDLKPSAIGRQVNLTAYPRVVVMPFTDQLTQGGGSDAEGKAAVLRFRQSVLEQLRITGAFTEVLPGPVSADGAIQVDGEVTRAVEGSRAERFWLGFGIGNAYFDATVEIRDQKTGELLATLSADRNSWGGGGWISAQQTLDSFIDEAARKIAHDLAAARVSGRIISSASERD